MIPEKLSREIIYECEWISLYADRVRFPDGQILDKYHYAHFDFDSVGIVIQNEEGEVLLIKSNRYITQSEEWEIPAGRVDKGECPVEAASRETLEETGYEITTPELIYRYNPSNGSTDQVFLIYKAVAKKKVGQFDTNEVSGIAWVSKDKVKEMLKQNEICCGFSLTGLMLVLFCEL
ncbi:MAG: NUDIX hydrolase [Oscillospiraceae bacterium]|nr:NUDIX hydrolase [Oscillospiraceae bacterium]